MSHKLVSLYIGDGEYYTRTNVDNVIAEKDKEIAKLKESVKGLILDNYLKDKEIAELKKQVHDYAQGLYVIQARAEKEIRHQKYKRCVANAEACMHKRWRTDEGFDYARSHRHMNKWLAIAEKFKEAK